MPSQTIKQQAQRLRTVLTSAFQQAPWVAENLERLWTPFVPEGAAMPDLHLLQQIIGRWLDASGLGMAGSEASLDLSRKDLVEARVERARLLRQLRRDLEEVRRFFDEQLGLEISRGFLPERTLSRLDPDSLQMVAAQVTPLLRDPQRFPRVESIGGRRPTATGLADALEVDLAELRRVQATLEPGRRAVDMDLELRNRELAAAVDAQRRGRDLLYGLYRAAGFDYVADNLRVRARKKRKRSEPPPATAAESGAGSVAPS